MAFSDAQLQVYKDSVLQYTRLGMPVDRAFQLADLSSEAKEALEKDAIFMRYVEKGQLDLEARLLEDLLTVELSNIRRGKSDEIRYLLGVIDPVRYGTGGKKLTIEPGDKQVTVHIGEEYKGI